MAEPEFPPSHGNDPRILGPIPTPAAQRWKEVRLLYLPRTVFGVGIIAAAWLWSSWVAPASMVAEAEIEQRDVRSAQAGVVATLKVDMLQPVHAGEVIGQIVASNPRLLDASLAVIRAEVGMISATMAGATDKQKNAIEFEKMQIDWMSRRVDLASLRGKLLQAESDFTRGAELHKTGLITDENYEQLKINRDALTTQVDEQTRLVAQMEPIVKNLAPRDDKDAALAPDAALAAAIKVQEAKLKLTEEQLTPVPLVSPIDGVVAEVLRHPGENVTAGEVVMRVHARRAERLTGFLRQPLSIDPKAGMTVEVRTRSLPRQVATTKITEVGAAMEALPVGIIGAMRLPTNPTPEHALRIQMALPVGLQLRPGEHVDVTIH
jgi:multidrug resistance efflux pump